MPTVPVYLRDAYMTELDTVVAATREGWVQLRETPLYPGGGGQPADEGRLSGAGVRGVVTAHRRDEEGIWHQIDAAPPAEGGAVHVEVEWPRRYAIMRHHSAVHVLCGVVYHLFGALVTGGQIYPDRGRMDFSLEDLNPERVAAIEREANRVIAEARPIHVKEMPRAEFERYDLIRTGKNLVPAHLTVVRIIEIEGFDAQADGGTHVANTREIGTLRITRTENKGRVNRRLEIALQG